MAGRTSDDIHGELFSGLREIAIHGAAAADARRRAGAGVGADIHSGAGAAALVIAGSKRPRVATPPPPPPGDTSSAWRSNTSVGGEEMAWEKGQQPVEGYLRHRFTRTPLRERELQFTQLRIPDAIAPAAGAPALLRLCTLNVFGVEAKTRGGPDKLTAWQKFARTFDVLCLQETHEGGDALGRLLPDCHVLANANAKLTEKGVPWRRLGVAAVLPAGGAVVAARITHRDFVEENVGGSGGAHPPEWPAARALTVELTLAGARGALTVLTVHRPYTSESGPTDANASSAWLAAFDKHVESLVGGAREDARVVVCGDFNASLEERPSHPSFISLRKRGFVDALAGTHEGNWPTHFPISSKYRFNRIDLIFVSPKLRACVVPYSGRVLSQGAPLGDHVPVEVSLAI